MTPAPMFERQRRRGIAHQEQAAGIEQRADAHHPEQAEAIGDRAGDGLAQSPQQILKRDREAEHVAAPGEFMAHRLHEEAERRARAEAEQPDRAAAENDDRRRAPGGGTRVRTELARLCDMLFLVLSSRIRDMAAASQLG